MKKYSIMYQGTLIMAIVFISKIIEMILATYHITAPASVVGLVILFIGLTSEKIKLEQVEDVGNALVNNIGLFFVPAGIKVVNSLDILKTAPVLILGLILLSTVMLLAFTGLFTQGLMKTARRRETEKKEPVLHGSVTTKNHLKEA
ncbi:antiholin-like murein hydrolase modulator LrgA [Vagococcus humatus]|uniref:Murein hydrolase transporter LrgA n=1 Tax=Vagococcus humatus TaxID=1889241 RepID=A0A429Z6T7_9ENTE|nr:antiholin-like murein hydrolase modulator LrgA [Vagococcus humatus]RST89412.1 murein hydrolase transporter LrgA [Vagococcus humatus]